MTKTKALGRKPKPADEKMRTVTFRATKAQAEKFRTLGGGAWVRPKIDEAPTK